MRSPVLRHPCGGVQNTEAASRSPESAAFPTMIAKVRFRHHAERNSCTFSRTISVSSAIFLFSMILASLRKKDCNPGFPAGPCLMALPRARFELAVMPAMEKGWQGEPRQAGRHGRAHPRLGRPSRPVPSRASPRTGCLPRRSTAECLIALIGVGAFSVPPPRNRSPSLANARKKLRVPEGHAANRIDFAHFEFLVLKVHCRAMFHASIMDWIAGCLSASVLRLVGGQRDDGSQARPEIPRRALFGSSPPECKALGQGAEDAPFQMPCCESIRVAGAILIAAHIGIAILQVSTLDARSTCPKPLMARQCDCLKPSSFAESPPCIPADRRFDQGVRFGGQPLQQVLSHFRLFGHFLFLFHFLLQEIQSWLSAGPRWRQAQGDSNPPFPE